MNCLTLQHLMGFLRCSIFLINTDLFHGRKLDASKLSYAPTHFQRNLNKNSILWFRLSVPIKILTLISKKSSPSIYFGCGITFVFIKTENITQGLLPLLYKIYQVHSWKQNITSLWNIISTLNWRKRNISTIQCFCFCIFKWIIIIACKTREVIQSISNSKLCLKNIIWIFCFKT